MINNNWVEQFEYDPIKNILYFFADEPGYKDMNLLVEGLQLNLGYIDKDNRSEGVDFSEPLIRTDTKPICFLEAVRYQSLRNDNEQVQSQNTEFELTFEVSDLGAGTSLYILCNEAGSAMLKNAFLELKEAGRAFLKAPSRGGAELTESAVENNTKVVQEVHMKLIK